jgi:hypothetical protein
MNAFEAQVARGVRLRRAVFARIRLVPVEPGPEFQVIPYACKRDPLPCLQCDLLCDLQPKLPERKA